MKNKKASCTTILVGKKAIYDNSTMMARNEDITNFFTSKKYIINKPEDQSKKYKLLNSFFEIGLPQNPLQYSSKPDILKDSGIFGEVGNKFFKYSNDSNRNNNY